MDDSSITGAELSSAMVSVLFVVCYVVVGGEMSGSFLAFIVCVVCVFDIRQWERSEAMLMRKWKRNAGETTFCFLWLSFFFPPCLANTHIQGEQSASPP